MAQRVVITAVGIVSSLGWDIARIIQNLEAGKVCFARPPFEPTVAVAPVADFDARFHIGRFKHLRYLNRGARFAAASACRAVAQSGLTPAKLAGAGLFVGAGPHLDIGTEFPEIHQGNLDYEGLAALWMLRFLPNSAAAAIAQLCGLRGENATIATACSASLQAIGEAFRRIKDGYLDVALAGGGDSRLNPGGILAYKKAGVLSALPGPPEQAGRPFDELRQGFVPGEGGAFLVLESLTHAQERRASIWGEVCGLGLSLDGLTMTAPDSKGIQAEKAVRSALQEAGLSSEEVDVISAHGTGTYLNDAVEADLIHRVFAPRTPAVTAFKSWIGHSASACGALETALLLINMQAQLLPEIRNLNRPCRSAVNFLNQKLAGSIQTAVIQNFGFGGQNCALVIRRHQA